ncbi:hypothetical protein [Agathobacter ruminis]|nr:hypothetical protein [Agathobacter ruminis]
MERKFDPMTGEPITQPKRLVCLFGCGGNRSRSRRWRVRLWRI